MNELEHQLRDTFAQRETRAPAGDDLVEAAIRGGRSRLRRRRGAVTLSLAGALGIGVAVGTPIVQGGNSSSQAFAVEQHGDDLTVKIYRFDDAAGLQRQLAKHGVAAKVVYVPAGETCKQPWFTPSNRSGQVVEKISSAGLEHGYSLTIRPSELADNDTLVILNADLGSNPDTAPTEDLPGTRDIVDENDATLYSDNTRTQHERGLTTAVAQGNVPNCQLINN